MVVYQKDSAAQRNIVLANATAVVALNEDGSVYDTSLYTPSVTPRIVTSREYAFFTGDNQKWDGTTSATNVTNWGLSPLSGTTSYTTSGAVTNDSTNGGTIDWAVAGIGTLTSAVSSDNSVYDRIILTTGQKSKYLKANTFGFAVASTADIEQLVVEATVLAALSGTGTATLKFYFMKNGVVVGNFASITLSASVAQTRYVRAHDQNGEFKWGSAWLATDINDADFGIVCEATYTGTGTATIDLDMLRLAVLYSGAPPAVAVAAGTGVTLTVGRKYTIVGVNSATGHISDITQFSASTGPVVDDQVNLTAIPSSSDTQVDYKYILATADGGDETKLYYLDSILNATTTYTDTTPETTLLFRNVYLELDELGNEIGITGNSPPPTLTAVCKHRSRIYGIAGQNIYYSKDEAELTTSTGTICGRYEECWPAEYFFDISQGVELPNALLSDGESLYIGTEKHIYRLTGDGPENFRKPEIAFNTVGVVNQEVWQVVYNEGAAAGAMWLTPTKRIMWSDMNNFKDVGGPIQDILDSINATYINTSNAVAASIEGLDVYILAIPTGVATTPNTLLVFDLGTGLWYRWTTTDTINAQLFNIKSTGLTQLLFTGATRVHEWDTSSTQDETGDSGDATNVTSTITTSWLNLGDSLSRKALNEVEILTESEDMTLSINGASNIREFNDPVIVISGHAFTPGPLGETKVPIAGRVTKDRFYQLTFIDTGTDRVLLNGYSIEATPLHKI